MILKQTSRLVVLARAPTADTADTAAATNTNKIVFCDFKLVEPSGVELQEGMSILLRRIHSDGSEAILDFVVHRCNNDDEQESTMRLLTQRDDYDMVPPMSHDVSELTDTGIHQNISSLRKKAKSSFDFPRQICVETQVELSELSDHAKLLPATCGNEESDPPVLGLEKQQLVLEGPSRIRKQQPPDTLDDSHELRLFTQQKAHNGASNDDKCTSSLGRNLGNATLSQPSPDQSKERLTNYTSLLLCNGEKNISEQTCVVPPTSSDAEKRGKNCTQHDTRNWCESQCDDSITLFSKQHLSFPNCPDSAPSTPARVNSSSIKNTPEFFQRMEAKLDKLESNDDASKGESSTCHDWLSPCSKAQVDCKMEHVPVQINSKAEKVQALEHQHITNSDTNTVLLFDNPSLMPLLDIAEHSPCELSSQSVILEKVSPDRQCLELRNESTTVDNPKVVLLFLQLGRNMIAERIRILSRVARGKGAEIVDDFRGIPKPTHLVIDANVKSTSVAELLGVRNPALLAKELEERGIETVKPEWIGRPGSTWSNPTILQLWNGLVNFQVKSLKASPLVDRKRPRSLISAGIDFSPNSGFDTTPNNPCCPRNQALSGIFLNLSRATKNCPLDPLDEMKSMMFNMVAGRLLELDFEVLDRPDSLARLKAIKGLGPTSFNIAVEFLREGRCRRLESYATDPSKVSMTTFMGIWGVGRAMAMNLRNNGYETLDDIRAAVQEGKLTLDPRARIGLDCYDDFNEKMTREEVEMIGDIVTKAIRETLPNAEISIMGSYRRGKTGLGDIDILIVDSEWVKDTPCEWLGALVTKLHLLGHMVYHLTNIAGISYDSANSQTSLEYRPSKKKGHKSRKTSTSQSYMGVFNSPTNPGRRRRIDIKFYPYREKAFAQLYFTGSGFFNRSMRLWARRCKGMVLNDHGLFRPLDKTFKSLENDRLPIECATEQEVFDVLGLVYKEPQERIFYDAVLPKTQVQHVNVEIDIKEEANYELGQGYAWID